MSLLLLFSAPGSASPVARVNTGAAPNRRIDEEIVAVLMAALPILNHRRVRSRIFSRSSSKVRGRTPR